MPNIIPSKAHSVAFCCALLLGAIACGSNDSPQKASSPPAAHAAPDTHASAKLLYEFQATPQTTAETGISVWRVATAADGSTRIEGATAAGAVRVRIAASAPTDASAGSMVAEVMPEHGAAEHGTLSVRGGRVVSNTLPASARTLGRHLATDFTAVPRVFDASSCSQAQYAYVLALVEEGIACAVAETPVTAALCLTAVAAAENAAYYVNIQCANCGGSCASNQTCDGAGTCRCVSNGCGSQCGNVVDNCGKTLYCGSCGGCTGCQGRCGNVVDQGCGKLISCGPCEDDDGGSTTEGDDAGGGGGGGGSSGGSGGSGGGSYCSGDGTSCNSILDCCNYDCWNDSCGGYLSY